MSVYALILCGGSGTRMGGAGNKTLLPVGGMPAIVRSVRAFEGLTDGAVLVFEAVFPEALGDAQIDATVQAMLTSMDVLDEAGNETAEVG